jgi:chromosome partitioning protein
MNVKKIIAVAIQKGGTGKSTTTINFSAGLALAGYTVLVVDLDPQYNTTKGLGFTHEKIEHTVQEVLLYKKDIRDVIVHTKYPNLDLLPASLELDNAEVELISAHWKEGRLQETLENVSYDFVVIDCRPSLGALTINALVACNFVIVPCQMAPFPLEGFSDFMNTVKIAKKKNGEAFAYDNDLRILITQYDHRNKVMNDKIQEDLKEVEHLIFKTRIRTNQAFPQSQYMKTTIFDYDPKSIGADDYKELTREFLMLCQLPEKN